MIWGLDRRDYCLELFETVYDIDYISSVTEQTGVYVPTLRESAYWERLIPVLVRADYDTMMEDISTEYPEESFVNGSLIHFFFERVFGAGKPSPDSSAFIFEDYTVPELDNVWTYINSELESYCKLVYRLARILTIE